MKRREREEAVFQEAADLPTGERSAFLDRACDGDAALRAGVERLLRELETGASFLETPALERGAGGLAGMPERVGQYRLLRVLGSGGMGIVYEAEQDRPRRLVAIKAMRSGLGTGQAVGRFERESEALARLQHPGIAQVYESGWVGEGLERRPWFAMELVRGEPLDAYADRVGLGVRERVEMVARVCDAVQHAHERGVVHRDLKPANVLVDGSGAPKTVDFGVARFVGGDGAGTLRTDAGQVIGTLAYMSPEQVAGDGSAVDARSDVYALGVMLYRLLSGRLPLDVRGRTLAEAARVIRDEEPSRLGTASASLRGDIDTIVSKAMEKEASRRYASAGALGDDLRRWLSDRPVLARPPSAWYQTRKFARRNKPLVAGVALAFAALSAGTVGATVGLVQARRSEAEATRQALEAAASRDEARDRAAEAAEVTSFLTGILSSVRPSQARGREVTVAETLDAASRRIGETFEGRPGVESALRLTLATTYRTLDRLAEAEREAARALEIRRATLGEAHADTLAARFEAAHVLEELGRYAEAEAEHRAIAGLRRAAAPGGSDGEAAALGRVAQAAMRQGRTEEAWSAASEALEMRRRVGGGDRLGEASALDMLARVMQEQGRPAEGEPLLREALAIRRSALGEPHPEVSRSASSLATLLHDLGRFADAEPLYRESAAMGRALHPEGGASLAISLNNLASLLQDTGRYDEARELFEESLGMRRKALGERHPSTATAMNNLGVLATLQRKHEEAAGWFRSALEAREEALSADHPDTIQARTNLAMALSGMGRREEAEATLREAIATLDRVRGAEHPQTLRVRHNLAQVVRDMGRLAEAEGLARWVVEARARALGADHPDTLVSRTALGLILSGQRRYVEAAETLAGVYEAMAARGDASAGRLRGAAGQAERAARLAGRWEEASCWAGLAAPPGDGTPTAGPGR